MEPYGTLLADMKGMSINSVWYTFSWASSNSGRRQGLDHHSQQCVSNSSPERVGLSIPRADIIEHRVGNWSKGPGYISH